MFDLQTYNSRDIRYKDPYGAAPSGSKVTFTLRPRRDKGYSKGVLVVRFEQWNDYTEEHEMVWTGSQKGRDAFTGTLELRDYVGLAWYSFRLEGLDGRREESAVYQLTVYDNSEEVPLWFGRGMSYQIFPDRFCRTRVPDPTGMVGGRWVHQSWEEEPVYQPDHNGEIRNRDFFGGDLAGITGKLDYLRGLGVETLYFCPIFEAPENHRYGTADYEKIDPMLGCEEDFRTLCREAHTRGMRVMLDGVFNHTGFVSRYFNGDGFYPEPGASQSQDSPYRDWFDFQEWPHRYSSWWGIYSLPTTRKDSGFHDFITGENGVIRRWLRAGADGWRLDVADELPDSFVRDAHRAARAEKRDAVIIGEVWEDGSNKVAYSVRRHHIWGGHCDGLMNYPLRNAILGYILGGEAAAFRETMEVIRENYPPFAFHSSMNFLGTHDTVRILTLLGVGGECRDHSRDWRAHYRLDPQQMETGRARLKLAMMLLFAFPGSPMIYYGDEAGMQGFEDPFNRRTFPWGHEDGDLLDYVRSLGALRRTQAPLRQGDICYHRSTGRVLVFSRTLGEETVYVALNAGVNPARVMLPTPARELLSCGGAARSATLVALPPMSGMVLEKVEELT